MKSLSPIFLLVLLVFYATGCESYRVNVQGVDMDHLAEITEEKEELPAESKADIHNDRGFILERAGDLQNAMKEYRQAIRFNPQHTRAWINLGNTWGKLGNSAEAIKSYRQALEIEPEHPHALNNLAWELLEQGSDPAEAVTLIKRAMAADRENRFLYLDSLGWALYLDGKNEEAETILLEAISETPEENSRLLAEAHYHLGHVLLARGANDDAEQNFNRSLELIPSPTRMREVQELTRPRQE